MQLESCDQVDEIQSLNKHGFGFIRQDSSIYNSPIQKAGGHQSEGQNIKSSASTSLGKRAFKGFAQEIDGFYYDSGSSKRLKASELI